MFEIVIVICLVLALIIWVYGGFFLLEHIYKDWQIFGTAALFVFSTGAIFAVLVSYAINLF
jgi:hypothetical protein